MDSRLGHSRGVLDSCLGHCLGFRNSNWGHSPLAHDEAGQGCSAIAPLLYVRNEVVQLEDRDLSIRMDEDG